MLVPCASTSDMFVEGSLDVPGAIVEIVECDNLSVTRRYSGKGAPDFREQLLVK